MNKISGDFSFVNKDERKQLEIPELTFEVKGDELATVKEDEVFGGLPKAPEGGMPPFGQGPK